MQLVIARHRDKVNSPARRHVQRHEAGCIGQARSAKVDMPHTLYEPAADVVDAGIERFAARAVAAISNVVSGGFMEDAAPGLDDRRGYKAAAIVDTPAGVVGIVVEKLLGVRRV